MTVELWDGRHWPATGQYAGCPVFGFRAAPSGLATRRQLRADALRPGGQDVAGWLVWGRHRRPRWARLFRLDLAKPKREPSPMQRAALHRATAARFAAACARYGHEFGPWLACGCHRSIADHQDDFFGDGLCAFEFRTCDWCTTSEERHVASVDTEPLPDLGEGDQK